MPKWIINPFPSRNLEAKRCRMGSLGTYIELPFCLISSDYYSLTPHTQQSSNITHNTEHQYNIRIQGHYPTS